MSRPPLKSVPDTQGWIDQALEVAATGTQIPFAIIERASGKAIGSTRYMDIRRNDRGLEIGWTWIGTAFQRTAMNTECKYLLLRHAFEELGAVRVQLKTDLRNVRSQRAIERLGAVREGVLRKHMVLWDGFIRDTVYYSVIEERVARGQAPPGRPAGACASLMCSLTPGRSGHPNGISSCARAWRPRMWRRRGLETQGD